jgi:hypothetical protein
MANEHNYYMHNHHLSIEIDDASFDNNENEKNATNIATEIPPTKKKKRQLSGYNVFYGSELKEATKTEQNCSKETVKNLMKSVASRWKTLSSEEKAKWNLEGQ